MKLWLFSTPRRHEWRHLLALHPKGERCGVFKNRPGVIPGRWGIWCYGFEIGSRNPSAFGRWLKNHGLWPW